MGGYTNGWTWADDATEAQRESVENAAHCTEISQQIAALFRQISDPEDEGDRRREEALDTAFEEHYERALSEHGDTEKAQVEAEAALKALRVGRQDETQLIWDQIEFFTQKLRERGARLRRAYEHWNEDEQRIRLLEEAGDRE